MILGLNIPILYCVALQAMAATPLELGASAAIKIVRLWADNGLETTPVDDSLPRDATGVCVLLRHNGNLLGYGEAFGESTEILEIAASTACKEAKKNPILRNLPDDVRNHALRSISIEVGIAGSATPIPSKNLDIVAKKIEAGVDALAVRRGKNWTFRLPPQMRLSPFRTPVNHLEGMCIKVGSPASAAIAHQLPEQEDVTVYKVTFISAYQHTSGGEIQLLYRGDTHVPIEKLRQVGLQATADLLASSIINSVWPGDEAVGITGTYQPEIDLISPIIAPVVSQAMAGEALLHYASMPDSAHKKEALATYIRIMNDLAVVNESELPIDGVLEQSFVVLAGGEARGLSQDADLLIQHCKTGVVAAARKMADGSSVPSRPFARAVLAAAISRMAAQGFDTDIIALSERAIKVCLHTTAKSDRASLIPWIAQAGVDVISIGGSVDISAIQSIRSNALASQYTASEPKDLLGGFTLRTSRGSVVDARGIRMLPMLADLLQVEAYTPPGDRFAALQSLLLAARFTSQLTTTSERASRFPNPKRALGGVRNATWDATMKPEATAMALIGISKAIESIYAVAEGG